MRTGLLAVERFLIPANVVLATLEFLRKVGVDGFEGFVLWAGELTDERSFRFLSAIIPDQEAMMTKNGLLVTVSGEALFEVNKAVHERKEILGAQVHTHPTNAYHSSTDDAFPMVTLLGALSVVIPDFAVNAPKDIESWAWYRLSRKGKWDLVGDETRIEIE